DVQIRAIQWVVADHAAPDGWRALRWSDLQRFVSQGVLDKVNVPQSWDQWLVDLDDLDPAVPGGLLPAAWQGKAVAEARAELPTMQENIHKTKADKAVQDLFDWRAWTLDKIENQEKKGEVRRALREQFPEAHKTLEDIFGQLALLAASPSY